MFEVDEFMSRNEAGLLSRREFFRQAGAAGLLLPLAGSIAAMAGQARAEEPKRGGWLRIAQGNTDDTLEPVRATSTGDAIYLTVAYQRLTRFLPTLEVEGDAASEWSVDPTAKIWTFKLRSGLTFHNGQSLTAADVKESLDRHIAKDSQSAAKALLSTVTAIDALDSSTIRITLSSGNADLPTILSDYHFSIHPAGFKDFSKPVGSGPFKVRDLAPGERITMERFDGYYEEGKPYLDGLDFIPVPDANASISALLAGDVDVIYDMPAFAVEQIGRSPTVTLYNTPTGQLTNFSLMVDRAPTNNADFRKGFKHALDRNLVLTQVFKGIGVISADTPIGPTYKYWCEDVKPAVYDPEKAKFHFKKAGISSLEIFTSEEPGAAANDIALTFQQSASKALNVTVTKTPSDGYWTHTWMQKPICMSGWNARPTVDAFLSIAHMQNSSWNETMWGNDAFDTLVVQARAELDEAKRKQMYCDLQHMLNDDGGFVNAVFQNQLEATAAHVKGYTPHPVGAMGGFFQTARNIWLN
ncbi:ABC transporter substrate-binding protein [Rhizobium sp. FKL33]|uniref:ABC transporter substrate-binding protein n=1 Tax=Rhizobium sp. FKL33 TaxID=2562307 RepID=UPI0010C0C4F8|nr:ABC transporter substrate-binding protein [Rhizobium sp. FKL33]